MRLSAFPVTALWLGSLLFLRLESRLVAELPPFRIDQTGLRPLIGPPRPGVSVTARPAPLPSPDPTWPRAVRVREEPVTVERRLLRDIALGMQGDSYALRTSEASGTPVRLSLGMQSEIRFTDNVSNLPEALAVKEIIHDVTPIVTLDLGDRPDHRTLEWTESEYYLNALYAPTWHRLIDEQSMIFLHHLITRAGRITPLLHTGVRVEYDDNLFASAGEGSPEDTFTVFEVVPLLEYHPSLITKLHLRGEYRRIALQNPTGNRTEYVADGGMDVATSVKTTLGLGAQLGRIEFDQPVFGTQRYVQGYVGMLWLATPKVTFQTQVGVEWREFDRPIPQDDKISPVATAQLIWEPSDLTRITAAFSLRNQPSIVKEGSLFENMRFAIEATQDIGSKFYARANLEYVNREYDTGSEETEIALRPALGYRITSSALLDTAQIEIFYQYRQRWNLAGGGQGFARQDFGMQVTFFF